MSYYTSKHPGLWLYLLLVCASVLNFLYMQASPTLIGILAMVWGVFILLRVLSLFEVSEYYDSFGGVRGASKNNNAQRAALAHDLSRRMTGQNHFRRGLCALSALQNRTRIWLVIAMVYSLATIIVMSTEIAPVHLIENIALLFMIGAAFWAGQSYAYSDTACRYMTLMFGLLFALTLLHFVPDHLTTFRTMSWEQIHIATLKNPLYIVLIGYSGLSLLYMMIRGGVYTLYSLSGLFLLCLLSLFGIVLSLSADSAALWMSGWALISIVWIRAHNGRRKRYILYQNQ